MAGRRNARARRGWGQGGGGAAAGGVQGVHGAHAQTVHGRGAPMVQAAGGRGGPHTVTWVPHPDPVLGSGAPSCRRGMPLLGAAGLLGRGPLAAPVGAPQALQPASLREGAALQSYPQPPSFWDGPGRDSCLSRCIILMELTGEEPGGTHLGQSLPPLTVGLSLTHPPISAKLMSIHPFHKWKSKQRRHSLPEVLQPH